MNVISSLLARSDGFPCLDVVSRVFYCSELTTARVSVLSNIDYVHSQSGINSGVTARGPGGGGGAEYFPDTYQWQISADLPGKESLGKKGKMEKRRRKIEKGRKGKVEN